MDAANYLKEKARMTRKCSDCSNCPLGYEKNGTGMECLSLEALMPEKAIEIVETWNKEHPRKTYLSDFLDKYPNAEIGVNGIPLSVCPYHLGYKKEPPDDGCGLTDNCIECWNTIMEDEE